MPDDFQAGVYDISEQDYHDDPVPGGSLSSTGARRLLPPSCPARYAYERDHPVIKAEFDIGTAAHHLVLGTGPPIAVIDAKDWRTNKAKDAAFWAREKGQVPLLARDYDMVKAMAAAITGNPVAAAMLDPGRGGWPEQSMFWFDERWGIWKRSRLDWMPDLDDAGRFIIADYKTADSAEPRAFARAAARLGYHQQHAWYCDGVTALGLGEPVFVFVVQEKTPPYLTSVIELDHDAVLLGARRNERACEIYRDCSASGIWPGYPPYPADVVRVSLPQWAYYAEREEDDSYDRYQR